MLKKLKEWTKTFLVTNLVNLVVADTHEPFRKVYVQFLDDLCAPCV